MGTFGLYPLWKVLALVLYASRSYDKGCLYSGPRVVIGRASLSFSVVHLSFDLRGLFQSWRRGICSLDCLSLLQHSPKIAWATVLALLAPNCQTHCSQGCLSPLRRSPETV
ncbi:hypothetical protein MRX96_034626 [Rhipicephalus microplus]